MNSKTIAHAAVIAALFSGLALAQGAMTDSDVRTSLAAQGYTDIRSVELDGDIWSADAKAAGKEVKLRIDSNDGSVYPDQNAGQLSPMDILQSIQAAGYTNIGSVSFYGGAWTADATSSNGQSVKIKVDPSDGSVIDEKEK